MSRLCRRVWLATGALALTALTGCSDEQLAAWVHWYQRDPDAAVAFARQPEIDALLQQRSERAAAAESAPTVSWTVDWDAIAACESGANWSHQPVTNSSGTYSGGLMWNHRYWSDFGGDLAPLPYLATKAQQIVASERLIDGSIAAADRAWQCYP